MAAKIVPTSGRGATSAADAVDDELNGIMDAVAEDLDNWDGGNDLYDEPPRRHKEARAASKARRAAATTSASARGGRR